MFIVGAWKALITATVLELIDKVAEAFGRLLEIVDNLEELLDLNLDNFGELSDAFVTPLLPIKEEGTIGVVDDFDALIELVNKTGELWAFGKELETVSEVTESDIEIVVALGFGVYTSVDVTNMFDEVAKSVDVLTDTVDVHSDDVGTVV